MGSHSLLQGIFLTQGSNPGLLYGRQILHHLRTRKAFGDDLDLEITGFRSTVQELTAGIMIQG